MSPPALFIVKPVAVLGFSFWGTTGVATLSSGEAHN